MSKKLFLITATRPVDYLLMGDIGYSTLGPFLVEARNKEDAIKKWKMRFLKYQPRKIRIKSGSQY